VVVYGSLAMAEEHVRWRREGFALIVSPWVDAVPAYLKQVDGNHLIGTGERVDISAAGYSHSAYVVRRGCLMVLRVCSFLANSRNHHIDFAGIHLYPQSWGIVR